MSDGVPLADRVAGDEVAGDGADEGYPAEASIFCVGRFDGGPPDRAHLHEVSVSIPVRPDDTFADYAIAIEAAVREIGALGYNPGYRSPAIEVTGTEPSWSS